MWTPKFLAKTSIEVKIFDGFDENGSPKVGKVVQVKARTESSNGFVYGPDGKKITLSQKAFIFEGFDDFYVGMSGKAVIGDVEHDIAQVKRLTNPDGTVNHFVLGLV